METNKPKWSANPTTVMGGINYILVTISWMAIDEDGAEAESRLCYAFDPHKPQNWERGLWQAYGAVNICRMLQGGLHDDDGTTSFAPAVTVH